ncbi:metal-sensitive transcriptional repressor [bacterium 1xD8-6]|nr:metal-sensitive transcriptional repressor [bacterium D16-36]RKI71631.1 metal-sensitive transcriptional repressor [bacterium 1xD8-6]
MEQEKEYLDNETTPAPAEQDSPQCSCRKKERSDKEYKNLQNRLSRIEGQVRGVKKMLENDAYCPDILIQVSAINAALNSFNRLLLANHIRTCVADDIRDGKPDTIDEFVTMLQKLMR